MGKSDDLHLHVGLIVPVISGAAATYLDFERASCLATPNRATNRSSCNNRLKNFKRNVSWSQTNTSYSLFAVVAGLALNLDHKEKKKRAVNHMVQGE